MTKYEAFLILAAFLQTFQINSKIFTEYGNGKDSFDFIKFLVQIFK